VGWTYGTCCPHGPQHTPQKCIFLCNCQSSVCHVWCQDLQIFVGGTALNQDAQVSQESHRFVCSWFCSHPTELSIPNNYSILQDQGQDSCLPWQITRFTTQTHHDITHMCDIIFIQCWPISSTMLGDITLKDHIIIQQLFQRSPVEFAPESTGNCSRSGHQWTTHIKSPILFSILLSN